MLNSIYANKFFLVPFMYSRLLLKLRRILHCSHYDKQTDSSFHWLFQVVRFHEIFNLPRKISKNLRSFIIDRFYCLCKKHWWILAAGAAVERKCIFYGIPSLITLLYHWFLETLTWKNIQLIHFFTIVQNSL